MATAGQLNGNGYAARNNTGQSHGQFRDIVRTIQKRRLLVILVVAIITLAGGIIGAMMPRHYSATAVVLIHTVPPGWFWTSVDENAPVPPQVSVPTQARLVATFDNAETTARDLATGTGEHAPIRATPAEILEAASVEVEEPDILNVSISSVRRDAVVPMVNTLAQTYVNAASTRSRGIYSEAGKFLEGQVKGVQEDLDDLNEEYRTLLEQSGMADPDIEVQKTQDLLSELRLKRTQVQQDLDRTRGSLGPLRDAVSQEQPIDQIPDSEPNPQYDTLSRNLAIEEADLARLQARYTQQHPMVQEALERVSAARDAAADLPEKSPIRRGAIRAQSG
ncbi:MAG TPA: Wzz/FepE/Etk N-terminal domain-containing protein [Armatimonadota bacterium]|nr:Wzz/FepE/Etk N-terminal domain-containing protein [Armatimonadota bacterium]